MAKQKRYNNGYLRKTFTYDNKRYYVYGRTSAELLQKENEKRAELENGAQDAVNPTLNNYYKAFTDIRRRELSESTLRAQQIQFKVIAGVVLANGRMFGDMRIKDITRRDVENTRQMLLDAGKTPQYLNICYAHLNHVLNNAVIDDTLTKNPCKALKQLKRDSEPVADTKHRALTPAETKAFFETAEKRNSYYINAFKVMINSGLRIGELTALYPADIDRKNGFIHVKRTIARDELGGYVVGDDTKTANSMRDIPLTPALTQALDAQNNLNKIIFGSSLNALLFRGIAGDILREYSINREIKRICADADIKPFTCHAFRNTFATRFIEQRPQDYKILSEILGHKDIAITLNLYTHVMRENKVKAMQDIKINIG